MSQKDLEHTPPPASNSAYLWNLCCCCCFKVNAQQRERRFESIHSFKGSLDHIASQRSFAAREIDPIRMQPIHRATPPEEISALQTTTPTSVEVELFPTQIATAPAALNSPQELFPQRAAEPAGELFPQLPAAENSASSHELFPQKPAAKRTFSQAPGLRRPKENFVKRNTTNGAPVHEKMNRTKGDNALRNTALAVHPKSGNATDIIVVRGKDGSLSSTPWRVVFSWSLFRSNSTQGVGDRIAIFLDDQELQTRMFLREKGRCSFEKKADFCPPEAELQAFLSDTTKDVHTVFFKHTRANKETRVVECRLYVWQPEDSVVVVDLDGTLTLSDVEGHIRTLRMGQYDFLHTGACEFFSKLDAIGCRILYLTARPIDWASGSRTHLDQAHQEGHFLPPGPLVTNSRGLTGALLTEVYKKNPHEFKTRVMQEIQVALLNAGRTSKHPVYVAGFGNRPTDVLAYQAVGMDSDSIFLIDPLSQLQVSSNTKETYQSYADPRALMWLLPKLKYKMVLEKFEKIDQFMVSAVQLAQLQEDERVARRLQQQEELRYITEGQDTPAQAPAQATKSTSDPPKT